ncbi:MAG TPA: lysozyme inhibitor LprI family protein [Hyphomonadaceae bacterium]|nr:lysozyme inhibitor LprI family protein [Hyphomonadaceae bacterium]HPI47505.1 lysozyme inhibitor LprI family protein [Hyphomonadaceae bacterium]
MIRMMTAAGLSLAIMSVAFGQPEAHAQQEPGRNCSDPNSQAEINMCAQADLDAADKEMNAVYALAAEQLREQDRNSADLGPQYVGAELLLVRSQAAWAANRSDFCAAHGVLFYGGSMRPAVASSCLALLARSRTEELRTFLE